MGKPRRQSRLSQVPGKKANNSKLVESVICWLFQPEFEELPVGLMAVTVVFTIAAEKDIQNFIWNGIDGKHALLFVIGLFVIISGAITAIFHLFSTAEKKREDKKLMLMIAAFCCIFSGVVGGYYLYAAGEKTSVMRLIGAWNGFQGLILAVFLHLKEVDENSVTDTNAESREVVTGLLTVAAVFALLKYYFELHWVDTFSVCIAVSMNISLFMSFFNRRFIRIFKDSRV